MTDEEAAFAGTLQGKEDEHDAIIVRESNVSHQRNTDYNGDSTSGHIMSTPKHDNDSREARRVVLLSNTPTTIRPNKDQRSDTFQDTKRQIVFDDLSQDISDRDNSGETVRASHAISH